MRKIILTALLILFPLVVFGQSKRINVNNIRVEYLTVLLDSTETDKVYFLFPPTKGITSGDRHAPSETAPTSASRQARNLSFGSSGHLYFAMVLDTVTRGSTDNIGVGGDSLSVYISPYIYDKTKEAYSEVTTDKTYLVFDTAGTYTASAADQLTWTHGVAYGVPLSNELWPCAGFVLTLVQVGTDDTTMDTNAYLSFWHIQ